MGIIVSFTHCCFFPYQCFFPQNLIANVDTPMFILNAAYDSWQVILISFYCYTYLTLNFYYLFQQSNNKKDKNKNFSSPFALFIQLQESLAALTADPQVTWLDCKLNHAQCSTSQIQFLQFYLFDIFSLFSYVFLSCPQNLII